MANDETSARPSGGGSAWLTQPGRLLRLGGSLLAAAFFVALLRFVALGVEDSLGTAFQLVITIGYGILSGLLGMRLGRHLGVLNRIAALILGGLALRLVTK